MKSKLYIVIHLFIFSITYSQNDVFSIARNGKVEEMIDLANKNPEIINSKNDKGYTPLILACYRGNEEVANYLIKNSKTINTTSEMGTPLMASVVSGNSRLIELLLKNGANPNLTDNKQITALMYACQFKNINAVEMLLKHNADKKLKDNDGKTAFEYAVFGNNEQIINLLKY